MIAEVNNVKASSSIAADKNNLFPIFLKIEQLSILIIGGGAVAAEKLRTILSNADNTAIRLVAIDVSDEVYQIAQLSDNIELLQKSYDKDDLQNIDIIISAANDPETNRQILEDARSRNLMVNFVDKPAISDFYLGSIVSKGNLKIAISTNGKSPTVAKRIKEVLDDAIPTELDAILENMHLLRNKLSGDFKSKALQLYDVTRLLVSDNKPVKTRTLRTKRVVYPLAAALLFVAGYVLNNYVPVAMLKPLASQAIHLFDGSFLIMTATGFIAQLVDGAIGMGYGVTCTSLLMSVGIPLPAISGSIHTAEMFSSAASGASHYKFGNINKKLFWWILLPGIVGAWLGAYLLSKYGQQYGTYVKPVLALYTLFLGARILLNAFKEKRKKRSLRNVGWLGLAGGFLDSFGGGGWGPLVTSTLISKGKTPRYVIGTVSLSEFFVTVVSAVTFFTMIGISHWKVIVALVLGGVIAAPIAAKIAGKFSFKKANIAIGIMIILWSIITILKTYKF